MPVQSPTAPTADPEEGTPPRAGAGDPGGLEEDLKEELVQMYARRDHLADAAFAFLRGMPAAEHAALLERHARDPSVVRVDRVEEDGVAANRRRGGGGAGHRHQPVRPWLAPAESLFLS